MFFAGSVFRAADDLSLVIDGQCATVISAEGAEIKHTRFLRPEKSVCVAIGSFGVPDNLPMLVDGIGLAGSAAKGAKVDRIRFLGPEKSMVAVGCGIKSPDDLALIVDVPRGTTLGQAIECPHAGFLGPEKSMIIAIGGSRPAHNLPVIVDGGSRAVFPAESAELYHVIFF